MRTADTITPAPSVDGPVSGHREVLAGGSLVALAALALALGMALTSLPMGGRFGLGLVAIVLFRRGFVLLGRRFVGPGFDPGLVLASTWLLVISVAAALATVLPFAESRNAADSIDAPILARPDLLSGHPFGTNRQGLDLLGGLAYGARISLIVGIGAVVIATLVGGLVGLLAGYLGGWFDRIASILTDSVLAFPELVLLLSISAILEANVLNVTIGLGILVIPIYVRLTRASVLACAKDEYLLAAESLGLSRTRIVLRQLLPNVLLPVCSYGFVIVGRLIVAEASLSYLGLSIQRPTPTWGNMIAAGQADFERHPHMVFIPGLALFLTVVAINRAGEFITGRNLRNDRGLGLAASESPQA